MDYEFRQLTSKDVFPMFKIISKIGAKEFKQCFESEAVKKVISADGGNGENLGAVGMMIVMDVAAVVIEKIPSCEDEIFNFLSSVTEIKRKDLEKMPLVEFTEMVIAFIKKPEFRDFIGVVSKLFK